MIPQEILGREPEFIIYLLILLFIGVARQAEGERIGLFLRSFTSASLVDQQVRQERSFTRLALLVFVFVLLVLSVFLPHALHAHGYFPEFSFLGLMLTCLVLFLLATTGRVALYAFISWLFQMDELQQTHTFHWLLTNFILCILLLPIAILYSFGPAEIAVPIINAGLSLLVLFYVIRMVRLFYLASSTYRVPLVYNFLYLCALEILPPLLVITVVSRQ